MGTLVDRLEVGKRFRVATHSDAMLASSCVVGLAALDALNLRVTTENHVYRVERLPSASVGHTLSVDATTARLAALRLHSAHFRHQPEGRGTGFVAVQGKSKPGVGQWRSGARVQITRLRAAGDKTGDLGRGLLMDDLEVGASARFAIDDGASLVTSPVRSLQCLAAGAVQVVTGNSTYRFDLLHCE